MVVHRGVQGRVIDLIDSGVQGHIVGRLALRAVQGAAQQQRRRRQSGCVGQRILQRVGGRCQRLQPYQAGVALEGVQRPRMVDAAFDEHIDIKIIFVEVKEPLPVIYFD